MVKSSSENTSASVAKRLRVLCLSTWPAGSAPAVRFRCEAYTDALSALEIDVSFWSFFTYDQYVNQRRGGIFKQLSLLLKCLANVFVLLRRVRHYDVIWLLREAAPFGPPLIEFVVGRLFAKPIVYEFDDAIWLSPSPEPFLTRCLRRRTKVITNIRLARHVIAGNAFLAAFAAKHNAHVSIVPTCVDVESRFNFSILHTHKKSPIVGWTGSHSTNRYLSSVQDVFVELKKSKEFGVEIISDRRPSDLGVAFRFLPWQAESEIRNLSRFDIGIMPLADTDWEKGKCGFKLVQYMALGIPVIASDVGHNREIVRDGIDGYLCRSRDEWVDRLARLIDDAELRAHLGRSARARIEDAYSVQAHVQTLATILTDASSTRSRSPRA